MHPCCTCCSGCRLMFQPPLSLSALHLSASPFPGFTASLLHHRQPVGACSRPRSPERILSEPPCHFSFKGEEKQPGDPCLSPSVASPTFFYRLRSGRLVTELFPVLCYLCGSWGGGAGWYQALTVVLYGVGYLASLFSSFWALIVNSGKAENVTLLKVLLWGV